MSKLTYEFVNSLGNTDSASVDLLGYMVSDYLKTLTKRDFEKNFSKFQIKKDDFVKFLVDKNPSVNESRGVPIYANIDEDSPVYEYIKNHSHSINFIDCNEDKKTKQKRQFIIDFFEFRNDPYAYDFLSRILRYIMNSVTDSLKFLKNSFLNELSPFDVFEFITYILIGTLVGSYSLAQSKFIDVLMSDWMNDYISKRVSLIKMPSVISNYVGKNSFIYEVIKIKDNILEEFQNGIGY